MSNRDCDKQKHVHELQGSTDFEGNCSGCHNHRFATITGEAIKTCKSHVHEVTFRTDFADEHYHKFCGKTGEAIEVGGGKHVHYLKECTDQENGHKHEFQAATLIESPTEFNYCDK